MSKVPKDVLKLPMGERALLALRAAVKKAIAERLREGLPVYVMQKGKVVDLLEERRRRARQKKTKKKMKARRKRDAQSDESLFEQELKLNPAHEN